MKLDEHNILWDLEAQHLEEAAFLVDLREAVIDAPNYDLTELAAGPDARLLAHVDALAITGSVGADRLLLPILEQPGAQLETVVAAALACLHDDRARAAEVLAALDAESSDQHRAGIARAVALIGDPQIDAELQRRAAAGSGPGLVACLRALADRWQPNDCLPGLLASGDREVAGAAARLARQQGTPAVIAALAPLAESSDAALQQVTIESALCLRMPGAWESALYWAFVSGPSPFRRAALTWVALLGDAAAHERLVTLVDQPKHRGDALWALGFCGRISAIERCLPLLDDPVHGPLAAEVVCAIAGLPVDDDGFWRDHVGPPGDAESALPPLEHDDLDAELVPSPEEALPTPEPGAITNWWRARADTLDPALRYLGGRPLNHEVMIDGLWHAPLRRRHNLALELVFRTAGGCTIDTRALAATQRRQLANLGELEPPDYQRGLPRA
ncbi:hypothetical protein [Enhygromyxa salina]|nr:hypothetical protein [Enhygromyxa salina]